MALILPPAKPQRPLLNRSHPLAVGLVIPFPFHEGAGPTLRDVGRASLIGTFSGATTPSWTIGPAGPVVSFNGTTAYAALYANTAPASVASVLSTLAGTNSAYSFAAPIKSSASTAVAGVPWTCGNNIIEARTTGTPGTFRAWSFGMDGGKLATARSNNTVSGQRIISTTSVNDNKEHLGVIVVDVNSVSVYIDGLLDATGTFTGSGAGNFAVGDFSMATGGANIYAQIGARTTNAGAAANWWSGSLGGLLIWNRALSAANVSQLYADLFAPLRPVPRISPTSALTSEIIGTVTKTLAAATLSATGTLPIAGALTRTLGSVTSSSAGTLPIAGALAKTLASVTASSTSTLSLTGALTKTLDAATLSATSVIAISGNLTKTLDNLTVLSEGASAAFGVVSAALDTVTLSSIGTLPISGTLGATLDSATLSATATLTLSGALAKTLGNLTLLSEGGSAAFGVVSATLGNASLVSVGTLPIAGAVSAILDSVTLSSVGTQPFAGSLAATLDEATLSAEGALSLRANVSALLDDAMLDATGSSTTLEAITGDLSVTLSDLTMAIVGAHIAIPARVLKADHTNLGVARRAASSSPARRMQPSNPTVRMR